MIKNLVFKGGGVRGIAYAGALQALEDAGIRAGVIRVAGASAGGITAMMVATKYTAARITEIVSAMNFSDFEEGGNPLHVVERFGWFDGNMPQDWLESLVKVQIGKDHATYADLHAWGGLDLRVVSMCMDDPETPVIFSFDTTPNAVISETVRASMSIPAFFEAMELTGTEQLYVDGGTLWNYPITIFDKEDDPTATLGLNLTDFTPVKYPPVRKGDWKQYAKNLIAGVMANQDIDIDEDPALEARTVRIDALGVPATEFNLDAHTTQALYVSGKNCMLNWLKSKFS